MCGWQPRDACECGVRRRHVAVGQIGVEGQRVGLPQHRRVLQNPLDLRGKMQPLGGQPVVEGLLAEAVARQQQPAAPRIPEGEREHAPQAVHQPVSLLLVEMHQHFRVAARAEGMTLAGQLAAQVLEVVDLTIEDDPDRAILVAQRLRRVRRQIDDRQPPMAEAQAAVEVHAASVGPAMAQHVGHAVEHPPVDPALRLEPIDPRDPAHGRNLSRQTPRPRHQTEPDAHYRLGEGAAGVGPEARTSR